MESRTSSAKPSARSVWWLIAIAVLVFFPACAGKQGVSPKPQEEGLPAPEMVGAPGNSGRGDDYRMAASHSLTMEGYRLLQRQDYEGAIRVLERAVGINPGDGPGYFYLAEAWLKKEHFKLADRFNELAVLYLRDHPAWSRRARAQKERIEQEMNKAAVH